VLRVRLAGGPGLLLLDALVLAWALAWIGAGIVVSREVRGLAELSDTAAQTGRAAMAVGEAVRALPLVGEGVRQAADEVSAAGEEALSSAGSARANARRVGDLLGVAIATIPTLPIVLLYVPARISATRERRDLEAALATGRREAVEQLLALRAAARLPLRELMDVSDDPAGDLAGGRHHRLAEAELRRYEISRRARARDR
jgi:hypothetical protein